jgi:hypothetical protein
MNSEKFLYYKNKFKLLKISSILILFILYGCVGISENKENFNYTKYESEKEKLLEGYERFYVCMGDLYTKSYFSSSFTKAPLQIGFGGVDVSIREIESNFKDIGFLKRNHFLILDSKKTIQLNFEIKKLNQTKQIELNPKVNQRTFIRLDLYNEVNEINCSGGFCYSPGNMELYITSSVEDALCAKSNFLAFYKKY